MVRETCKIFILQGYWCKKLARFSPCKITGARNLQDLYLARLLVQETCKIFILQDNCCKKRARLARTFTFLQDFCTWDTHDIKIALPLLESCVFDTLLLAAARFFLRFMSPFHGTWPTELTTATRKLENGTDCWSNSWALTPHEPHVKVRRSSFLTSRSLDRQWILYIQSRLLTTHIYGRSF